MSDTRPGRTGERSIPFTDFHRLPGDTPERDNALERGDLIVTIEVPARAEARAYHYLTCDIICTEWCANTSEVRCLRP